MSEPTTLNLDQMTDEMFDRLSAVIGQCINHPTFSGFAIDEETNSNGEITKIAFVPCDLVGGMPIRRSERNVIVTE